MEMEDDHDIIDEEEYDYDSDMLKSSKEEEKPIHRMSKAERIQELVQKMKAGSISKSELFTQLSQLQRTYRTDDESENIEDIDDDNQYDNPPSPPPPPPPPIESTLDLSMEDKRTMLINRLLEEKRQQELRRGEISLNTTSYSDSNRSPNGRGDGSPGALDGYLAQPDLVISSPQEAKPSPNESYSPTFIKMRKLQEELYQREMQECTFKPKIKKLPQEYGANSEASQERLSFEERCVRWKERKQIENERKRLEQEEAQVRECTFAPKLHKKSPSQTPYSSRRRTVNKTNEDVGERLYRQSQSQKLAELQAKARADEEAKFQEECTFRPNITVTKEVFPSKPRYLELAKPKTIVVSDDASDTGSTTPPRGYEECTFKPRTNPVPPSMESATVYLSNGFVDRLSRTSKSKENKNTRRRSVGLDVNGALSSMNSDGSFQKAATRNTTSRPSSSPSQEEIDEKKKNFSTFLARQQQTLIRKQQRVDQLREQTGVQPPRICKKSEEIVKNKRGNFAQRLARDAQRKEQDTKLLQTRLADPECTFSPQISKVAQKMPARTVTEMSRGDSLRKETNVRLMKLRDEQEKLESLTFSPELNLSSSVEGRLKILSDPDTYVERLNHKNMVHTQKSLLAVQEQEIREMEECTFHPEIRESPEYIKQIVQSLALSKRIDENAEFENKRPDWR